MSGYFWGSPGSLWGFDWTRPGGVLPGVGFLCQFSEVMEFKMGPQRRVPQKEAIGSLGALGEP